MYLTGGYANANILRTVAAMKKVKVSIHIYIKRAFQKAKPKVSSLFCSRDITISRSAQVLPYITAQVLPDLRKYYPTPKAHQKILNNTFYLCNRAKTMVLMCSLMIF